MDESLSKQMENEQLNDIINDLKEENAQLQRENQELSKKLSESITEYQKINNEKLSNQVHSQEKAKYLEENQELKSRISILNQKYSELEKSFDLYKKSTNESKKTETELITDKYNEASRQIRIQKLEYENKIQSLQEELYKEKNQNASLNSLNNKLLHVASLNYNQEVNSIEELIKIVSAPKVKIVQNPYQEQIDSMNHNILEYEEALKEAKKQIKLLTSQLQSTEDEKKNSIQSYEALMQQEKEKYKDKIKALKMALKARETNEDVEAIGALSQRAFTRKFRSNSTQTDESKDSFIEKDDYEEKIRVINTNQIEIEQLKSENNELYQANIQLQKEKESIQDETMNIANKVKARIDEISILKNNQQQLENSNKQLNDTIIQLESDNTQLRNELENTKNTLTSSQQNVNSMNEALDFLAKEQENLSKEIESLTVQRNKSYSLILLFNNLLKTQELCIEKQTNKIQEMKKELEQSKFNTNSEVGTDYVFDFSRFPTDLGKILSTITANDLISFNTRLNNVFSVIIKWVNNREYELKTKTQELENKLDSLDRKVFLSIEDIKKLTKDENVNIETLPKLVLTLLEEKEKSEETAKANAAVVERALKDNGINEDEDISDYIASLISTQNDLKQKMKSERQEMNNEREVEAQKKKALKDACRRKDEQIKILEKTNAHNRNQIEQLQNVLSELQDNNKQLIDRFNDTKENDANDYRTAQNKYEDEVYNKIQEIAELRATTSQQIQELTKENKEQKNQIELLQASKQLLEDNLNQKAADLEEISGKYYEINKVAQRNEEEITKMMQKKVDDANLIIQETNEKMEKIKAEHQNEIKELTQKLADTELNVNKLNNQINELGLKLKKGEREKKIREDSFQRSQKLLEAQTKAKLVIAETNAQMKLEEEKNKNDAKISSIYTFFAETFGTYYDASQKISEESFKDLVLIVKKELEKARKQEQAVRLFFNANETQTTDEAMTKYIIDNHPKLKSKL